MLRGFALGALLFLPLVRATTALARGPASGSFFFVAHASHCRPLWIFGCVLQPRAACERVGAAQAALHVPYTLHVCSLHDGSRLLSVHSPLLSSIHLCGRAENERTTAETNWRRLGRLGADPPASAAAWCARATQRPNVPLHSARIRDARAYANHVAARMHTDLAVSTLSANTRRPSDRRPCACRSRPWWRSTTSSRPPSPTASDPPSPRRSAATCAAHVPPARLTAAARLLIEAS